MKYFAILNDKHKLIAYHEEMRVVSQYLNAYNYQYYDKDPNRYEEYRMVKIKSKVLKKYENYEDLYLIRYGCMFIQSGYYQYIEDDIRTITSELYLTKDVLSRIFEFDELTEKEEHHIRKALEYVSEKIADTEETVYPLSELESIKSRYEDFRDAIHSTEHDDWRWNH